MNITLEQLNNSLNLEERKDVLIEGVKIYGKFYITINDMIKNGYCLSE